MLSYQSSFFKATEPLTSEIFSQLIISDKVVNTTAEVRRLKQSAYEEQTIADSLPPDDPHAKSALAFKEAYDQRAASEKRKLPKIVWQATFDETTSKKGLTGRWRKQSAAHLNGLFMLDVDHIENPIELFQSWIHPSDADVPDVRLDLKSSRSEYKHLQCDESALRIKNPDTQCGRITNPTEQWAAELGILLVHVTPSGHGLRFVAIAQMDGNLSDNQHRLASLLGVECDESCKDASRLSFCPSFNDILYINKEKLFSYENKEYDEKWGPTYRGSGPTHPTGPTCGPTPCPSLVGRGVDSSADSSLGGKPSNGKSIYAPPYKGGDGGGSGGGVGSGGSGLSVPSYYGASYSSLVSAWFKLHNGGVEPAPGDRHRVLLRLAGDLRYACNNKEEYLSAALQAHPMVRAYAQEDSTDFAGICHSVCERQLWSGVPKRLAVVLQDCGVQLPDAGTEAGTEAALQLDYEAYWSRLQPLVSDGILADAIADLPNQHKLAGVLAAGAMLGTYLTRTWWEHYDGKFYRLSFLVYIIGAAASGKSFITLLDKLLLAPLLSADRIGRQAEAKYTDLQKRRKANEQLPDRPHPVIRYCPSSTSNAILYRRLQDAVDNDVIDPDTNEPLHLHLITVESEIATALRSQVGSWAGKADLELKSFHNECAGVDYANADSTNGPMQINWNQVMSGTLESMSRKITPKNVLDGLVTRLVIFPMPSNDYMMLERRRAQRNHERECRLRQVGYDLEKVKGELHVPRLVDFCYQYEEELTRRALLEQDACLDYFRKRIPVIMMRYALVRLVLRQLPAAINGEDLTVDDSDIEFARLIGDWCLEAQIHMFGQMVMDAQEAEAQAFKPRGMQKAIKVKFDQLPDAFTITDLLKWEMAKNSSTASTIAGRWEKAGIIKKLERGKFKKVT